MDNTREKLIDVFMHMGDHIRSLDEYGFCFDSTLAEAVEDVVAMLKNQDANGVTLDNQVSSSTWIPVTERLPEESGKYLAYCGEYDGICVLYYEVLKTKGKWRTKWKEVTHWMPLPEPPKGE